MGLVKYTSYYSKYGKFRKALLKDELNKSEADLYESRFHAKRHTGIAALKGAVSGSAVGVAGNILGTVISGNKLSAKSLAKSAGAGAATGAAINVVSKLGNKYILHPLDKRHHKFIKDRWEKHKND